MKSVVLTQLNQVLQIAESSKPELAVGQVLVMIKSAALNHRDVFIQKGMYAGIKVPVILGSDGAGKVTETFNDSHADWINKEVIINPGLNWGGNEKHQAKDYIIMGTPTNGTFAQYVSVSAELIHPKPAHLNWNEAAALPLAGVTAYRALMVQGNLQKNDKVLITGIGGGVAQMALQFAIANGNEVWVTTSNPDKLQKAIAMGARGGIDYKQDNWHKDLIKQAGEFDVIIESACGEGFGKVIDCCKPGGTVVIFGGTVGNIVNIVPAKIFWRQISIIGSTMGSNQDFAEMLSFVNKHQIKPIVSHVFNLEQAQEALDLLATGNQFGKIVLKIS